MRDLGRLEGHNFDLIIIGGGITGANLFWDASLRGLSCLLLEQGDYGHATSSATSKMVHGGLRYLKFFDFGVVRESLKERRILQEIAPHQVHPLDFLIPCYPDWERSRTYLGLGMGLYEILSYDKANLTDPDQRLKPFRSLSQGEVLAAAPLLPSQGLTGGYVYQDGQMQDPERLVWCFIQGGRSQGGKSHNHVQVTDLLTHQHRVRGVKAHDHLTHRNHEFKARVVINAAGPWADRVEALAGLGQATDLVRSKGIHLILPRQQHQCALTYFTPEGHHFFLLPWKGKSLLGTTDEAFAGQPEDLTVTEEESHRLLQAFCQPLGLHLGVKDIEHAYAGLRPMTSSDRKQENLYQASRRHEVVNHGQRDGLQGFYSTLGGKFTTSRQLAEECLNWVCREERFRASPCKTASTPVPGGRIGNLALFTTRLQKEFMRLQPSWLAALAQAHGEGARSLCEQAMELVHQGVPAAQAEQRVQVVHAVRNEQARHLSDLVFRRLSLGNQGAMAPQALQQLAGMMGELQGWNEAECARQISLCEQRWGYGRPFLQPSP